MPFDPSIPYNDLPPLPPPIESIETAPLLKKCISARVALAELKQAAELIPNAAVLVNALPLLEAQASSEIENIVTTTDKLLEFVDAPENRAADPATKEALRYRRALFEGVRKVQSGRLTVDTAIDVCRTIKDESIDLRSKAGTTLRNIATAAVIYTPPVGKELIREKLENWQRFLTAHDDLDPLIRCAVQHYQFEAIHPFADGNGRTGRILNILYLVQQGLLDTPILYLSRYIIRNKADYYRLLLEVTTKQSWAPWIVVHARQHREHVRLDHRQDQGHPRPHAPHRRVHPPSLAEDLHVGARRALVQATVLPHRERRRRGAREAANGVGLFEVAREIGVLREINAGRESLFVHPKYIELLTGDENVWVFYAGIETDTVLEAEAALANRRR